ncbi:helix-turn-helix domain-containing protein [Halomonas pacifica]|uniref:helix-turn-helix domain-containing protein n=1 Tax=Bisbaumannia pacifica TaxID=77098 RepID=UPI002358D657|nr:helix-turn-helix domain-containing protein [Halomonas pacifica]MDC8802656.1 helix-turn-helix domain-containing protein [Halomonas pacifica]
MSVQAISWALEQQVVTDASARHVLVALANHADNKGRDAYPSVNLLCRYTGLKRRTVLDKLKLLQDMGVIVRGNQRIAEAKIKRADRRPVVYDIRIDLGYGEILVTDEQEIGHRDAGSAPRRKSRDADAASRFDDGVQVAAARGADSAPKPSLTKKIHTHMDWSCESPREKYQLDYDWEPNLEMFYDSCLRRNMSEIVRPSPEELANFVGFYSEVDKCLTDRGWNDLLARWCSENRYSKAQKNGVKSSSCRKSYSSSTEENKSGSNRSIKKCQASEDYRTELPRAELAERLGRRRADLIAKRYGSDKVGAPAVEEMRRTLRT